MNCWAILTGEYAPQPGGVADYTRLVNAGLAAAGDAVTVYAPPAAGLTPADPGVTVRRLPDHFGPRGLLALDRALATRPRPDCILVQYVPHAYGWKAMNLPFVAWIATRARRIAQVWVMFHEVMYPIQAGQSLRQAVLGRVNREMARVLACTADRMYVSTPRWGAILRRLCGRARSAIWLPIPSNLPDDPPAAAVAATRTRLVPPGRLLIGHFGTFGHLVTGILEPALVAVLRASADRTAALIGRESHRYCESFTARFPDLKGRVAATGELPPSEAAAHLAACDVLLQPYLDGVCTRRTSLMAGLALGVPVVTNAGCLTEPIWKSESAGVIIAQSYAAADLFRTAEELLALSPAGRVERGRAGAAWYRSRFTVSATVARLQAELATSRARS